MKIFPTLIIKLILVRGSIHVTTRVTVAGFKKEETFLELWFGWLKQAPQGLAHLIIHANLIFEFSYHYLAGLLNGFCCCSCMTGWLSQA